MDCRICREEIDYVQETEQFGLCDKCYDRIIEGVYKDMCKGCKDEKYCRDNETYCRELDEEVERRIKNEL